MIWRRPRDRGRFSGVAECECDDGSGVDGVVGVERCCWVTVAVGASGVVAQSTRAGAEKEESIPVAIISVICEQLDP